MEQKQNRSSFSGKIGFVLSAAGASVGLGNIWRFPYLAAKYGGGIFLLIYIILALTFGYTMIVAETALGRMTGKSPVGAYASFASKGRKNGFLGFGGWINAIIPVLIVPYYSVIGGWVIQYLFEYLRGNAQGVAADGYFSTFIADGASAELCFFALCDLHAGHHLCRGSQRRGARLQADDAGAGGAVGRDRGLLGNAARRARRCEVLSGAQPGQLLMDDGGCGHGPDVLLAVDRHGYPRDLWLLHEKRMSPSRNPPRMSEIFDTAIAIMAGLMIIPAVFAFSGGDPDTLQAGPALMFITIPKVFASMGLGTVVGVLFFLLVLFAAVTSSIALTESAVSTFEDELGWSRKRSTVLVGVIMVALGTLSSLGYGPLAGVTVIGMQFLDFFDFLTNSVMMPIAAIATCLLVSRVIGVERIEQEVELDGQPFRRKKVFRFMIRWLCPIFAAVILASSVANAFGIIKM